ncbi:MAG: signal peptidase I [Parcubacteria group bacterium]|nr:signal peptidase I [Parcubacteria group bacterium]|tara:strand:- start:5568 stop:6179 length:612 start_codon:yes stop_codon:yes gene_type:complete
MNLDKNQKPKELEENLTVGKQAAVFVWEIFKVVVISLAIIIPVRYFIIKPFYVKGASMEPNFYDREYLIINEISYYFETPIRGDSVVFRYPYDPNQYFIKRIVAMPGEKIKISDGKVFITKSGQTEEVLLEEDYLLPAMKTLGDVEVELALDEYYLLGDNRLASLDSRAFGPVKREYIIGKTLLRGWPLNQFGLVGNDLEYNL